MPSSVDTSPLVKWAPSADWADSKSLGSYEANFYSETLASKAQEACIVCVIVFCTGGKFCTV